MKNWTHFKTRLSALFLAGLLASTGSAAYAKEADQSLDQAMEKQKAAVHLLHAYWQRCIPVTVQVDGLLQAYSPEELSAQAAVIATGKITGRSAPFQIVSYQGDIIVYTDFYFTITGVSKGAPYGETVSVRVPGGTVGARQEVYPCEPQFNQEDEYLLFLYNPGRGSAFVTEEEHYFLLGSSQGAYAKNAAGVFVNTLTGEALPENALVSPQADGAYGEDYFRHELEETYRTNYESGFDTWEEYQENLAELERYAVKVE